MTSANPRKKVSDMSEYEQTEDGRYICPKCDGEFHEIAGAAEFERMPPLYEHSSRFGKAVPIEVHIIDGPKCLREQLSNAKILRLVGLSIIADRDDKIQELEAEVARLREVVDKLPKTVDGVTIYPGMNIAVTFSGGRVFGDFGVTSVEYLSEDMHTIHVVDDMGDEFALPTTRLYSTPEAAKQANTKN